MDISRRWFAAATVSLLLCACSRDGDRPNEKIVVGFSQINNVSEWRQVNTSSIIAAAATSNIELQIENSMGSQENQVAAIRKFIKRRVDVIALSPIVRDGWDPVLREAQAAKIPVILTDRAIEVSDQSLFASHVGPDFVEEGRKAGRWLLERYKETPTDVNIVELQGAADEAPTADRKLGFEEWIAASPRLHIIHSESAESSREKAREIMARILKETKQPIHVLFSHHDQMTLGAIKAIEAAGLRPAHDIVIVSIDAEREAFKAMIAGKLNVTVECSPTLGPALMTLVTQIVAGNQVPRRVVPNEGIFPMESAAAEFARRKY